MRRTLAVVFMLGMAQLMGTTPAASQSSTYEIVRYEQPVWAPVVDPFRPPAHIGAPGNRGIEYGNQIWAPVFAAAEGVVFFAGKVAGTGVVSIVHADGVKTTYTGMDDIWVTDGRHLRQGATLGTAARNIHFGAVLGDHYLDPQILIDESTGTLQARLVPPDS